MKKFIAPLAIMITCIAGQVAADQVLAQHEHNGTVFVTLTPPPGGSHWQPYFNYTAQAGANLVFTDQCPSDLPNVVNGAFDPNAAARKGLSLVANFRNQSDRSKWTWAFNWPSGAPAGAHISFSVYCVRKS